ncbi:MAG: bifunctional glutamate N-acetyltransferase/amino-acid acetyltransferase ArgJ [Gammaproteobacteria bacterium]|nr:bifunctional glutamate N-acetyltransferase/amino-acid acetyltransferase ArgJ [Gammaproteobacteria bacterium]
MAVNLDPPSILQPVAGIRLASTAAGIAHQGRDDLALIELCAGTRLAAVFTRNAFCAAPVELARRHLSGVNPRYLLVNSGNANAGTGEPGRRDALACCQELAAVCECQTEEVIPFSTGVIGERLPATRINSSLPRLKSGLSSEGWLDAAQAIMTTDTLPKGVSRSLQIDGRCVTITGIAKGAGMMRPDMATMLAYVATDASLSQTLLEQMLRELVGDSFNSITVDGDTSTNDACVLIATGRSKVRIRHTDTAYHDFYQALAEVMTHLAQAIVRDGEGATKFITVWVKGALSEQEAREVAYTVAHSPLVKTAFYAQDPNWGRLLAAVGRANVERLDMNHVDISLDEVTVFSQGGVDVAYSEQVGQRVMARPEITVGINLHRGEHQAKIWTTDLSGEYVRINAEYRS